METIKKDPVAYSLFKEKDRLRKAKAAGEEEEEDYPSSFIPKAQENEEKTDLKVQLWTDAEDQLLFEALEQNGMNWSDAINYFNNTELRDFNNRSLLQVGVIS